MAAPAEDNNRPQTIVDKALAGTANSQEFHEFAQNFMNEQNKLNMRETRGGCSVSGHFLDWDFGGGASLAPVIPYHEMETSDKYIHARVTVTNVMKKRTDKRFFEVMCQENARFKLQVDQRRGALKPGKSITIHFRAQVFCTTKVYQMLKITIFPSRPKSWGKAKLGVAMWEQLASPPAQAGSKEAIYPLWAAFKMESELSNQIDWDEIKLNGKIAKGGFGTVFRAEWRGSDVAVKLLNTQELVEEEKEMVKREMVLMSKLASPYMVTYMGSTLLAGMPWSIIMEYVSGGSLTDLLTKHNSDMTLRFKVKLLQDIVAGMTYLHAHHIWHRDIKPDNMLVISAHETGVNLKVTDFGTSKASAKQGLSNYAQFDINAISEKKEPDALADLNRQYDGDSNNERRETRGVGTLIYQSPEILAGSDLGDQIDKTDVYAFGILMWEVYTAVEPYSEGKTEKFSKWDLEAHVQSGQRPDIPPDMPRDYLDIMRKCWAQEPSMRPAFTELSQDLRKMFESRPESEQLGIIRRDFNSYSSTSLPQQQAPPAAGVPTNISVQLNADGVPVPYGGNLVDIGWGADMSRQDAELRLQNSEPGTFIIRWSSNTTSYVLTYSKGRNNFQHIAYIQPVEPDFIKIKVDKEDGKKQEYANLFVYVETMKGNGIIKEPCRNNMPTVDGGPNMYAHTPKNS